MSAQPSIALPSVGETFGACYIGSILAAILYGISNLQVVIYYKRYPNDQWVYRYSVALLWVLDTLHVILSTHAIYFYLVTMFGDFIGGLEKDLWTMKLQLSLNNFIVVLYAIRLWKLGRYFHKTLPCFVLLAVATSLGNEIVQPHKITDLAYGIRHIPNLLSVSIIKKSIYVFCSTIAATDMIIAPMMCYYLHKSRRDTIFSTTAALLVRLMRLVLVSGVATSAISLSTLIAFIVWPESLIFVGIHFVLSKLYINSLLAMLNSRSKQRSTNRATEGGVNSLPTVLQITPHSSEGSADDTDKIGIPLQHISSFGDKMNYLKGPLECQV
ncbi:hypothetical protein ARMSODRAFT_1024305 [Armillaria solidipes]|uniref:DUF6534 domain-containing protein n=1 Tax=Armillaria solidipes TaxID=1076256 RepID=A0A2H3BIW5_9AGAR|nr:hypothetical protein ARMSODRAFT_1024305 [Armillaria solidipes]